MAAPSLFVSSNSAINPDVVVPVALVISINKSNYLDPNVSTSNIYAIEFKMNTALGDPASVYWEYITPALRNAAFTALKVAVNNALT